MSCIIRSQNQRRHRGFSLVEILFAVIILAIGFIMVAALFPVAIGQARATKDIAASARIDQMASSVLNAMMQYNSDFPVTSTSVYTGTNVAPYLPIRLPYGSSYISAAAPNPITPPANMPTAWEKVRGSLIVADEPHYGWTFLYSRNQVGAGAGTAAGISCIAIKMAASARQTYNAADLFRGGAASSDSTSSIPCTFEPRAFPGVTFNYSAAGSTVTFQAVTSPTIDDSGCLGEGAFVIVADAGANAYANGTVLRLGSLVGGLTWNLDPSYPLASNAPGTANVYVVGRQLANPADGNQVRSYDGPVQDIAVTTFNINP